MSRLLPFCACFAGLLFASAHAEVIEYEGSSEPLDYQPFIHVVSESESPLQQVYIKANDGVYVAAALRRPKGEGPFPAVIFFHGAPGGRGMEQLIGWSRGDHGGPAWERFLQEGFVVVVADYRGGPYTEMNTPSATGLTTAIDDGLSVIEYVRGLAYVDASHVSVYGVSLGGNLAMYLAAAVPDLHAVVAGAPAPIWFLGCELPQQRDQLDLSALQANPEVAAANIEPIQTRILLQVGTDDSLLNLVSELYEQLLEHGKDARLEIYQHGYHDFVLGPQGHDRQDLPSGEILLQGALDALDRSVAFISSSTED